MNDFELQPLLIHSTAHDLAHATGVYVVPGLHERDVARGCAIGLSATCSQCRTDFEDLRGDPGGNWGNAVKLMDKAQEDDRRCLTVEVHCNSSTEAQRFGTMMFFPWGWAPAPAIEGLLKERLVPIVPPNFWQRSVGLPDPKFPLDDQQWNWGYLRHVTERGFHLRPAILIELGYIQSPEFCTFISDNDNQARVGFVIGQCLCDWLSNP